ncbi:unnamed protein product, partial [Rotaria socialis]
SSSSSENDDHDNEIREEHEEESINEPKSDAMDVDEDGWVTVRRRTGGKK